jgi:hypothetical protein
MMGVGVNVDDLAENKPQMMVQSEDGKIEDKARSGKESTHKHLPSSLGAIHNPKNRTMFGCRHSAMILHSLSKYFITYR